MLLKKLCNWLVGWHTWILKSWMLALNMSCRVSYETTLQPSRIANLLQKNCKIACIYLLGATYASEPQRRVLDFCVSFSDLSELRRALNFPSRAGNL